MYYEDITLAEFFYKKSKEYKSKIPGAERIVQETIVNMKKLENQKSELKYYLMLLEPTKRGATTSEES